MGATDGATATGAWDAALPPKLAASPTPTPTPTPFERLAACDAFWCGLVTYAGAAHTATALVGLSRGAYAAVTPHLYAAPVLRSPRAFHRLVRTLTTASPLTSPPMPPTPTPRGTVAASWVRTLRLPAAVAADVYLGDLDRLLAVCRRTRHVAIDACVHLSNLLIRRLAGLAELEQLWLTRCPLTAQHWETLIEQCPRLHTIGLDGSQLPVGLLSLLVGRSRALRRLSMNDCATLGGRDPTDPRGLVDDAPDHGDAPPLSTHYAAEVASPLVALSCRNTPVAEAHLRQVLQTCPNLADLDVADNPHLTDALVCAITVHCPRLRRLELARCTRLTDRALAALALSRGHRHGCLATPPSTSDLRSIPLEYLGLADLPHLGFSAVLRVIQNAPQLASLALEGCDAIRRDPRFRAVQRRQQRRRRRQQRQARLASGGPPNGTTGGSAHAEAQRDEDGCGSGSDSGGDNDNDSERNGADGVGVQDDDDGRPGRLDAQTLSALRDCTADPLAATRAGTTPHGHHAVASHRLNGVSNVIAVNEETAPDEASVEAATATNDAEWFRRALPVPDAASWLSTRARRRLRYRDAARQRFRCEMESAVVDSWRRERIGARQWNM
ncbi:hypothetical protein CXG81DRAFT_26454 [Caulochytrium protostelioides]|uniref:RNI-like protein n=1 Tax=Caulochytrium protostelioides TaxID=1555241 RepID=A0A4V1IUK0_9FUNG|nr:hypothetical protein CXG81DRAFT_26454 [Caulochytrium protostelioides]|eukprot:RKP00829.1 hypothetical protein CXG81DRAFT_26454 [Caulochytrium protostelioides]